MNAQAPFLETIMSENKTKVFGNVYTRSDEEAKLMRMWGVMAWEELLFFHHVGIFALVHLSQLHSQFVSPDNTVIPAPVWLS